MNNFKKLLGIILVASLIICSVFSLFSCQLGGGGAGEEPEEENSEVGENPEQESPEDFLSKDNKPSQADYTVTVKDKEGNTVSGVKVKLVAKDGASGIERFTDENGKATYKVEVADWRVQLYAVPEGYKISNYSKKYEFTNYSVVIVLETDDAVSE